jgi:hypothetical protein
MDMERHLAERDSAEVGLSARLVRVQRSADAIWAKPRLYWFTDHTSTRHSRRIIQLLGEMVERLQTTSAALTRSEVFVLLAAAYLHDIGMQDFAIDGRSPDSFSIDDYNLIRDRHPARGKELIVSRSLNLDPQRDAFRIDLDDRLEYLLPIALVSQGHGSTYFEATVNELREAEYAPENMPLRGALLTALLLMTDELDLHEDRASFPAEMHQSSTASLHHHLNHYVTRVSITNGSLPRFRAMRVSFSFPAGSESYQSDLRSFVVNKLAKQARRINSVLLMETSGELEIDPRVVVRQRVEAVAGARRALPERALAELQEALTRSSLVGRTSFVTAVNAWLEGDERVNIELLASDDADTPLLMRWLLAFTSRASVEWVHLDFGLSVASEQSDVVQRLASSSGHVNSGSLCEIIAGRERGIYVFENAMSLREDVRVWLANELRSTQCDSGANLFLVVRQADATPLLDDATWLSLDDLDQTTLGAYMTAEFGDSADDAMERAEEMMALSSGSPGPMQLALTLRRFSNFRLDEDV